MSRTIAGQDLRVLDLTGVDREALAPWIRVRPGGKGWSDHHPPVWDLGDGRIVADVGLIGDMNWWGIAIESEARDHVRRVLWPAAEPTVADVRQRMAWRCRVGLHGWYIASVALAGHQSSRDHVCERCRRRGLLVERREPRGYFGGNAGPMGKITVARLTMQVPA